MSDETDFAALRRPPPDFTVRRPTPADLDAVAAIYAACDLDHIGRVRHTMENLRQRWSEAGRLDDAIVVSEDGSEALVAYAEFHEDPDPFGGDSDLYVEGRVLPTHVGRGLGRFLLQRSEDRARRVAQLSGRAGVILQTSTTDPGERAHRYYDHYGFVPVRHFLEMRIRLDAPAPPTSPAGVRIVTLAEHPDERGLWAAMEAGFADHWDHEPVTFEDWRYFRIERDERFDPALCLLALHDDADGDDAGDETIVGGAICRAGMPEAPDVGYVADLAVLPAWRRRGVGLALLRRAFDAFAEREIEHAGLEVDDLTLDGAARLYERAGMEVFHRVDVYEKAVRAE